MKPILVKRSGINMKVFFPLASPVPELSIPELINNEKEGKTGFSKKKMCE
jgi:hypothetical protein